jgi:cysteine desulfurase
VKSIVLALEDLDRIDISKTYRYREELENFLAEKLRGIGGILSDRSSKRNSNTIYFYFNDFPSDVTLAIFDLNGLQISAGSACSSGAAKDSLVMRQAGLDKQARNGLRISLPFSSSQIELESIKEKLSLIIARLK